MTTGAGAEWVPWLQGPLWWQFHTQSVWALTLLLFSPGTLGLLLSEMGWWEDPLPKAPVMMKVIHVCVLFAQSCLTHCDPWTVAWQAPLSMGFSRQEYWSGLPFPSPGDLPNSRITSTHPAWQVNSPPLNHQGSSHCNTTTLAGKVLSPHELRAGEGAWERTQTFIP